MKLYAALRLVHGSLGEGPYAILVSGLAEAASPGHLKFRHVTGDPSAFARDDYIFCGMALVGFTETGWAYTEVDAMNVGGVPLLKQQVGPVVARLAGGRVPNDRTIDRIRSGGKLMTLAALSIGKAGDDWSAQMHHHPDLDFRQACALLRKSRRDADAAGQLYDPDETTDPRKN